VGHGADCDGITAECLTRMNTDDTDLRTGNCFLRVESR
jgi:hypothetical protein